MNVRPLFHDRLTEYYRCPIVYESSQPVISFNKAALKQPLPTANPEVVHLHEKILLERGSNSKKSDLTAAAKDTIVNMLSAGVPKQAKVAKKLNMSTRNFQRKLREEGTSFSQILERLRHKLALEYVRKPTPSLGEISYILGFSSTANFSRAFKRWTNQSPGKYRENVLTKQIPSN